MKSLTFQPMLAAREPDDIVYPIYASPKLDGVRAVVKDGSLLSRKLKKIPNHWVRKTFEFDMYEYLDGELILGDPTAPDVFRKTMSAVMSEDGAPNARYYVFDYFRFPDSPFARRLLDLQNRFKNNPSVVVLEQTMIHNREELETYESDIVNKGYEGVMIRSPHGLYKFGRSTAREGYLVKIKRFDQSEARVLGFEELEHNNNPLQRNELGKAKRSHHKANMVAGGTLGRLLAVDVNSKVKFSIGTGFTDDQRSEIWANQDKYRGGLFRYKFFPVGVKDKPRHPVFLEWLETE